MATRKRTVTRPLSIITVVQEYLLNRALRERAEFHEGDLKKHLMAVLEVEGEQVDENKQIITLGEALPYIQYKSGKPVEKKVTGIERRKRTSMPLDQTKAMVLLRKKGLLDECTSTVTVVEEDAVLAANYDGRITDKELATIYGEHVTFAFYLTEE